MAFHVVWVGSVGLGEELAPLPVLSQVDGVRRLDGWGIKSVIVHISLSFFSYLFLLLPRLICRDLWPIVGEIKSLCKFPLIFFLMCVFLFMKKSI